MTRARALVAVLVVLVGAAGIGLAELTRAGATEDRGTANYPEVTGVDVQIDSGRVDVVGTGATDARIERVRHYLRTPPALEESVVDGILRVRGTCPRFVALGCAVDLRVQVPPTASVRVRTGNGSVSVDGMVNGAEVTTSAGPVRLLRTGGALRATTSAGSIEGVDLAPAYLDARADAGRIRMSFAEAAGRVDVQTAAGSIDLGLPGDGGYRVTTATDAGRVDVTVADDPGSSRAVTARTDAGDIRIHPR
jgi:DUF4097 and DUF4098 domain-containing protein YvlB